MLFLLVNPNTNLWQDQQRTDYISNVLKGQNQLIRQLNGLSAEVIYSLRYCYEPAHSIQSQVYIVTKPTHAQRVEELLEHIFSIFQKGSLSKFYEFRVKDAAELANNLDWINVIGEVSKGEEFLQAQNLYLPYIINSAQENNMRAVRDIIHRLDNRFVLEITLKTIGSHHSHKWMSAIAQMVAHLETAKSTHGQDPLRDKALALWKAYQNQYSQDSLFEFNIRALAENRSDAMLVLQTLIDHANPYTSQSKQCSISCMTKGETRFEESLNASQNIDICNPPTWQGEHHELGQKLIKDLFPAKKSLRDLFDDGSMGIPGISSKPSNPQPPPAQSTGSLIPSGRSFLSNSSDATPQARICDLQPLSQIATAYEISDFFRIFIPTAEDIAAATQQTNHLPESITLIEVIQQHGHLITEDSYIVGIDETGSACVSSWADIPHRLIAGVPGSGKTNFIKSVIYQFLYVNPNREVWIADFQAGMHYQLIADSTPSLRMVTELDEFAQLLNDLWNEHSERRNLMREERVTSLEKLQEKSGIKKERRVLIVDEAFFILNAERPIKNEIDKHLTALASQSRVTGIHIMYCSQRPTPEVIPSQIADNIDERVIFRVQSSASTMLLNSDIAAKLPPKPKGRAIYRGSDEELKMITTPYVPEEIWENYL